MELCIWFCCGLCQKLFYFLPPFFIHFLALHGMHLVLLWLFISPISYVVFLFPILSALYLSSCVFFLLMYICSFQVFKSCNLLVPWKFYIFLKKPTLKLQFIFHMLIFLSYSYLLLTNFVSYSENIAYLFCEIVPTLIT